LTHTITFLRHGESEGNLSGVIQGQSDYPLTQAGIEQANRLAVFWKSEAVSFNRIISSPLLRASETAKIIGSHLDTPIEFEPIWMERNFGSLQGENLADLERRSTPVNYFHPYERIGGTGESQVDLYTRACLALQHILQLPRGSYLVVSHGGILNKALYVIMGITPQGHYNSPIFHFGNTGYAQFRYNSESRQWAVICLNNQARFQQTLGIDFWKVD
jgi:2,3-bisphosphoglycerate-dependent phosphoglycerate mutase